MEPDDIFSILYPAEPSRADEAKEREGFPAQTPLAMAYVPMQKIGKVYEPEVALNAGTLYPELDKPFLAGRGMMADE